MTMPDDFARELGPARLEMRAVGPAPETRQSDDGDSYGIVGYASLFDEPTTIEGLFSSWQEEVAQGAWKRTLKNSSRIVSTFNHDPGRLLGATDADTAKFSEDVTGLRYEVDINPDDPFAMSVYRQVERGDVKGASVWFRVIAEKWEDREDKDPKRTILEAQLFEAGPVVFPAFPQTTAGTRSLQVVDAALRARGVKEGTRSRLVMDALTDHAKFEDELWRLLEGDQTLRDAVCACHAETVYSDPAVGPPEQHPTGIREYYDRIARGYAALGLR